MWQTTCLYLSLINNHTSSSNLPADLTSINDYSIENKQCKIWNLIYNPTTPRSTRLLSQSAINAHLPQQTNDLGPKPQQIRSIKHSNTYNNIPKHLLNINKSTWTLSTSLSRILKQTPFSVDYSIHHLIFKLMSQTTMNLCFSSHLWTALDTTL